MADPCEYPWQEIVVRPAASGDDSECECSDAISIHVRATSAGVVPEASADASIFDLEEVWAAQGDRGRSGEVLWRASVVLASMMLAREKRSPGANAARSVIELGAGLAIAGLAIARGCARLTLTDLPEVVPAMEATIARNAGAAGACAVNAAALDWYDPSAGAALTVAGKYDVALASDCIYEGLAQTRALLKTAEALLREGGELVLLSGAHRDGVHVLPTTLRKSAAWEEPEVRRVDGDGRDVDDDSQVEYVFVSVKRAAG